MYCEFYEKNKTLAKALETDLKTIKGYVNRAKKMPFECEKIIIYYCSNSIGYYSDKTKNTTIFI